MAGVYALVEPMIEPGACIDIRRGPGGSRYGSPDAVRSSQAVGCDARTCALVHDTSEILGASSMTARSPTQVELLHLVARASEGARPLRTRVACFDLWQHLGARFDVLACVLMPDHVHLLAGADRSNALRIFARILSSFRIRAALSREYDCAEFGWEPLPQPQTGNGSDAG